MVHDLVVGMQFMVAATMLVMAVVMSFTNRGKVQSHVYNLSRWLFVLSASLLFLHMVVQFFGHYREENQAMAWTINIFFYDFIVPAFALGELNLLRAGRGTRYYCFLLVSFYLFTTTLFAVGYFTNTLFDGVTPLRVATSINAVLQFMLIVYDFRLIKSDSDKIKGLMIDEELDERLKALHYTSTSLRAVLGVTFIAPVIGLTAIFGQALSLIIHILFGVIMVVLMTWFFICFIIYGMNMSEVIEVSDEIYEATEGTAAEQEGSNPDELIGIINRWIEERHFTDPNLTIHMALRQMGISSSALTYYLEHNTEVMSYRKWLPYLRVEEAKRQMADHPEYSLQAIAEACGYANHSALTRTFKQFVGKTPTEWLTKVTK